MGTSKPVWAKAVGGILDMVQIIIAFAVIVLTSWKLLSVEIETEGLEVKTQCVLDGSGYDDIISGTRFCAYAIGVGVVSLLVSVVFGCIRNVFKCVTLNKCALSRVVSIIGDIVLAIWWAVAFVLFLQRGRAANDKGWPNRTERDAVIGLAFGGIVSFIIDAVIIIWTIVK